MIGLLEKWRSQLEYEAMHGPDKVQGRNILKEFDQSSSELDSLVKEVKKELSNSYISQSKPEFNNYPLI